MKYFIFSVPVVLLMLAGAGCVSRPLATQPTAPAAVEAPIPAAPSPEVVAPTPLIPTARVEEPQRVEILMSQDGFKPAQIGIKKGGIVVFRNVGANAMWPASDPHPVHTNYQRFDARHDVGPGETYELNFPDVGVYTFHDHLSPGLRGRIVVGE